MLTQKETTLLTDLRSEEKLAVDKYQKMANEACDDQLKSLFQEIGSKQQKHYDTVSEILNGSVPSLSNPSQSTPNMSFRSSYDTLENSNCKQTDSFLCSDALASEKHIATSYNTDIFEFRDTQIRNALNHIQTEEQQYGEQIYNYMKANGMYNSN